MGYSREWKRRMNNRAREHLLERLDDHRACLGQPGEVVRELAPDRSECRIVLARASPSRIAALVAEEKALADREGYKLEWKVYDPRQQQSICAGARRLTEQVSCQWAAIDRPQGSKQCRRTCRRSGEARYAS